MKTKSHYVEIMLSMLHSGSSLNEVITFTENMYDELKKEYIMSLASIESNYMQREAAHKEELIEKIEELKSDVSYSTRLHVGSYHKAITDVIAVIQQTK